MMASYLLLFGSAFLAATILPFYSEVLLFALLQQGGDPVALVIVATLGNTLGAVVNWVLGRYLLHFKDRRWFYFNPVQIEKAQRWFQRYGFWSLLLAWMPVGGDALTLIAGIMKVRLWLFLLLVGTGVVDDLRGLSVRARFVVYGLCCAVSAVLLLPPADNLYSAVTVVVAAVALLWMTVGLGAASARLALRGSGTQMNTDRDG